MAKQIVILVDIEGEAHDEILEIYLEDKALFLEYGETRLVVDAKEFLKAVIDEML